MNLFFDTETTGRAHFNLPASHPQQPKIVQLAAMLTDSELNPISSVSLVINPGCTIPDEAASIHGITTEIAETRGVCEWSALGVFCELAKRASRLIAHNIDFDDLVMKSAIYRTTNQIGVTNHLERFCTMKSMTNICQIPGAYGNKWPKLSEAYKHATGSELKGAHDAMADVAGCVEVYRWMKAKGLTPCSAGKAVEA